MEKAILKKTPDGELILFFPETPANPGYIMSYQLIGEHCEASLDFYRSCRPYRHPRIVGSGTDYAEAQAFVSFYEKHFGCKLKLISCLINYQKR